MRRFRIFILLVGVVAIVILVTLLVGRQPSRVNVVPLGHVTYDAGYPGYLFAVTNLTNRKLEVEIWRIGITNSPNAATSYVYRLTTSLKPMAGTWLILYPPVEGVRWSVDVRCLRYAGKVETKLRTLGARFRLCKREPQWEYLRRIEIEK
jgi:hypothetical protein